MINGGNSLNLCTRITVFTSIQKTHCAPSRKVEVSIPDGVNGIFRWHIPSAALWPWDQFSSNGIEYQVYFLGVKGGRCVGLTKLQPSCAESLEIWEPQPPGTLRVCKGLYSDCFTFTFTIRQAKLRFSGKLVLPYQATQRLTAEDHNVVFV